MKTAGSGCCQPFLFQLWNSGKLPVSATVSAPTVETSTAMEPATTTVKTSTAVETTGVASETAAMKATITASEAAAVEASAPAEIASAVTPARSPIEATSVIAASIETAAIVAAAIEARAPVKAVEPWSSTDKHAVDKVVRAVVAIRRTTIRVIPVIAVGARRSRPVVRWADSNADKNSLCMGRNCHRKHANRQQRKIF